MSSLLDADALASGPESEQFIDAHRVAGYPPELKSRTSGEFLYSKL